MARTLVQARFTIPSGDMVNTFAFEDAAEGSSFTHQQQCREAVTRFYVSSPTGFDNSLGARMASWVESGFVVTSYDFNAEKPRPPTISAVSIGGTRPADNLGTIPMDVAMCMTVYGAAPITRRNRGRLYLGGIKSSDMVAGGPAQEPKFASVGPTIQAAAYQAALSLIAETVTWCVHSRAGQTWSPIVGGYFDTEPDTQRRRGMNGFGLGRVHFGTP